MFIFNNSPYNTIKIVIDNFKVKKLINNKWN